MFTLRWHLLSYLLIGALLMACCARAQDDEQRERITNFHSDITVNADASMQVKETIAVIANGQQIKHGIYRDFPTVYRGNLGQQYHVGFQLINAERDGTPEPYRLSKQTNGIRVYLGNANLLLAAGKYTYTLSYTTNHQLGFFPDHDELYWNVTGNGWVFPIDKASATVTLPANIVREKISVSGFSGSFGSTDRDLKASVDAKGRAQFVTTKPLKQNEGLTIVTTFPKGAILPPTKQQQTAALFATYKSCVIAALCLLALFTYYLIAWFCVGRDPKKGVIIPLFAPPQNLSPAAVRYVREMHSDNKTITAALINLAVKGYVTITDQFGVYTVNRVDNPDSVTAAKRDHIPSTEEQGLLDTLLRGSSIILGNLNYQTFQAAQTKMKLQLQAAFGTGVLFTNNAWYKWIGLICSVGLAAGVVCVIMAPDAIEPFHILAGHGDVLALFIVGNIVAIVGGGVLITALTQFLAAVRQLRYTGPSFGLVGKVFNVIAGIYSIALSSIGLLFGLVLFFGGIFLLLLFSVTYSVFLFGVFLLHAIFWHVMQAYTANGRKLLDEIEGFRCYLSVAEVDRLQSSAPPEKTPQLFEAFLPYALALDVEQQWSQRFADVLAHASVDGHSYHPSWYSGMAWSSLGAAGFASNFGGAFTSAISSSSAAPGSSSGSGGGGSSGGGGGGGGGGGW